jgi:hypothetical protein
MKILVALVLAATVATSIALTPAEQREYVKGLQVELNALRANLEGAENANAALQVNLDTTKSALLASYQKNETALAVQTAALTQLMRMEADLKVKDEAYGKLIADNEQLKLDKAAEHAKYIRAKFFIGGVAGVIAAMLCVLLLLKYAGLALNTLPGLGVVAGAPIVVGGLVFGAAQLFF